jgi:RND family efflux transporter MFP subunit
LAITELERFEPLAKSKAISDSEFQKLKAERVARQAALDSAVAQRNLARKAVDDSVIRAPFSGQVVERFVQTGEFVMPPAPVVHLVEVSKLRLVLNVPETAASLITTGQKVYFKTALFEDETFSGVIAYISGALRATARDLVVEALVDNDDQRLKPGYFAEADIQLPHQNVLCIPTEALRKNGSNTSAFVLKNGEVEERLIDKGVAADGWVEIRKGVQEGESVIITSDLPPKDGMKASLAQP